MNLNPLWLLTGEGQTQKPAPEQAEAGFRGIPVVSRIAAGALVQHYATEHPEHWLPLSERKLGLAPGDVLFGLTVAGDSMEPWMIEGDVAVCSGVQSVQVGYDVAFYQHDTGESTIKRLERYNRRDDLLRLRPVNPKYEPFNIELAEGDQVHRVVYLWRDAGRRWRRDRL